jgi:hypothetical protein
MADRISQVYRVDARGIQDFNWLVANANGLCGNRLQVVDTPVITGV